MRKTHPVKRKSSTRKLNLSKIHTHPLFSVVTIVFCILIIIAVTHVLAAKPQPVTGQFELEDVTNSGALANNSSNTWTYAMTRDGNFTVFPSDATNLGVTNGSIQYFVRDRSAGTTELVSLLPDGSQRVGTAALPFVFISSDGRYVSFTNLDIAYLRDRTLQTTTQLPFSNLRYMTPDARYFVYAVYSSNNSVVNYWLYDNQTNTNAELSVNSGGVESDSTQTSDNTYNTVPNLSDNGQYLIFASDATNLVANHPTRQLDIYIRDRVAGTTSLVYPNGIMPNASSDSPRISGDARFVAFHSSASNLVLGDTNGVDDVFLIDRQAGTIERENITSSGAQATGGSSVWPTVSSDGRFVAFKSTQPNLNIYNQTTTAGETYLRDRSLGTTELISQNPTCQAVIDSTGIPFLTDTASYVVADSVTSLDSRDTNTNSDSYLRNRSIPFGRLAKHCHK